MNPDLTLVILAGALLGLGGGAFYLWYSGSPKWKWVAMAGGAAVAGLLFISRLMQLRGRAVAIDKNNAAYDAAKAERDRRIAELNARSKETERQINLDLGRAEVLNEESRRHEEQANGMTQQADGFHRTGAEALAEADRIRAERQKRDKPK